ncbi:MAG: F0F1 ATP synthase subunit A [Acidobacteriia bacterium]|nr:F0F1 ATP synthase subunit A [Terriglobia bacterium]
MPEHELLPTLFFNHFLAGPGNAILALVGEHASDPAKPWANWVTMQILVLLFMVTLFAVLRPKINMDKPGKLQHIFEVLYEFLHGQSEEIVGHHGPHYLHMFGTLFLFILFANLMGVIPAFESPTMFPQVPLGCALVAFLYYNLMGFKAQGVLSYLKHFMGPSLPLAPIMIPIEIVSHLARPLSLTIRLFANMYASEQVTLVFLGLVPLVVPTVFMGLHVFVSFLQAYIFVLLTMVYVAGSVEHEH